MAATSPNEENGPRMNVDQSVSGAADDNGHYLENSSAVLCWPSSRSCRHAFAVAGA